jgi:hypothetical protein
MWLKYGVNEEGILICIEDINRGKTSLQCPYCHSNLTAKKGKVKEHHFAHNEETCRPIANREFPTLPLYDNFNVQLQRFRLLCDIFFSLPLSYHRFQLLGCTL